MSEPIHDVLIIALALVTSTVGSLGGLGGAILLVPLLTFGDMTISQAAPLGLVSVIAGSVAAGRMQSQDGAVNHRFGVVTGLAGVGGGFLKTPLSSELMRLPAKVAAATSTFTIGLTASTALLLMALDGRVVASDAALVVLGSLLGGTMGSQMQRHLSPPVVRRTTSVVLVVIAVVMVVRA